MNRAAWGPADRKAAAAAFGLAFALRAFLAARTPVIGADSAAQLLFAQDILGGVWENGLRSDLHPGYPLAISLAGTVLGNLEVAGYAVSVLFSSLAVIAFYALVRDAAGTRVAFLSSLILACVPRFVREHGDVMTEGLFHFFALASFALSWFGATRGRASWCILAGITGGLAYLTRPEGIYTVGGLVGAVLLTLGLAAIRRSPPRFVSLLHVAAGLTVFLFLAFPLLSWYRHATGTWTLSPRVSLQKALEGMGAGFLFLIVGVGLAAVGGIAWALRKRVDPAGTAYLLCGSLGAAAAPLAVAVATGQEAIQRHFLLSAAFVIPFAALLLITLADAAERRWGPPWPRRIASAFLGLALLGMAVVSTRSRRTEEVTIRESAIWLKSVAPRPLIFSNTDKPGFYVGRRTQELPETAEGLDGLRLAEGQFVLVMERRLSRHVPEGMEILERRFRRIGRFPAEETPGRLSVSVFAARP